MTHDALQFAHGARPVTSDVRVFDVLTRPLLGAEFTFRVIGSSHYVSAPAYDFYELASCEPVDAETVTTVPLAAVGAEARDRDRTLTYERDDLSCSVHVESRPLDAFPAERSFDLAYWFEERAATTIDVGEDGYETYHTYPERDLALYTRTVFERVPDDAVERERPPQTD
jgi:hypothetical protein